ncbi:hypothetical protein P3589_24200 [Vibrio parahaemolyticus]|nr:hypothetical protein [Vibrio parahaemolyticus]
MTKKTVEVVTTNGEVVYAGGEPVTVTIDDAIDAVEKVEEIPFEAKDAIKDFVTENWDRLVESYLDIEIPTDLLDRFSDFAHYIEVLFKFLGL